MDPFEKLSAATIVLLVGVLVYVNFSNVKETPNSETERVDYTYAGEHSLRSGAQDQVEGCDQTCICQETNYVEVWVEAKDKDIICKEVVGEDGVGRRQ